MGMQKKSTAPLRMVTLHPAGAVRIVTAEIGVGCCEPLHRERNDKRENHCESEKFEKKLETPDVAKSHDKGRLDARNTKEDPAEATTRTEHHHHRWPPDEDVAVAPLTCHIR